MESTNEFVIAFHVAFSINKPYLLRLDEFFFWGCLSRRTTVDSNAMGCPFNGQ